MTSKTPDLSDPIQRLIAKSEIEDVMHRYCRAVDRCDAALLRTVFHDDAVIEHPPLSSPADIFCHALIEEVQKLGPMMHYTSNLLIEFADGIAYTEAYFTAWHRLERGVRTDPNGVFAGHDPAYDEDAVMGGRYFNWFTHKNGGWRIARHLAAVEWEHWGRVDERSPLVTLGRNLARRGPGDPAYQRA